MFTYYESPKERVWENQSYILRVDLSVRLFNELTKTEETIKISALVIDSPIDLILGLPTIREHNLLLI